MNEQQGLVEIRDKVIRAVCDIYCETSRKHGWDCRCYYCQKELEKHLKMEQAVNKAIFTPDEREEIE